MSSHIRTVRRAIKRSGETAGQNLKPAPSTLNCFVCNRVVRRDRTANRSKNVCPQCWDRLR